MTPIDIYAGFDVYDTTGLDDYALPERCIEINRDGGMLSVSCCGDEMTAERASLTWPEYDFGEVENADDLAMAALVEWVERGMNGPVPRDWAQAEMWALGDIDNDNGERDAAAMFASTRGV